MDSTKIYQFLTMYSRFLRARSSISVRFGIFPPISHGLYWNEDVWNVIFAMQVVDFANKISILHNYLYFLIKDQCNLQMQF